MGSLYTRLPDTDIRLVTVNLHDGAVVSLELHTHSRTAAPEYDAVSYTWGDDDSTTSVICNEGSLEIRTNLFRALPFLHSFRPEPRTRPLWIDAICLNQQDRDEKAVHVPLIGQAYENATRTLIWLGEAKDDSDLAMENIKGLTEKLLAVQNPGNLTIVQNLIHHDLPPSDDPKWKAVKVLQQRPWLYRLWTLQEVVLSKQAILLCGRKSVPWDTLVTMHKAAFKASLSTMVHEEPDPNTPYKYSQIVIGHVDFLQSQRNSVSKISLSELLTLSADRGYSLPIDRIWALTGLLNHTYQRKIREANLVSYSDDAISNYHETFLSIMKFHVKHDTNIAMRLIQDNQRTVRNSSLPSWCPDWHTDRGGVPLSRWPEALAGIPGGGGQFHRIEPFMQINQDSSLDLCGLQIDTIECVTTSTGQNILNLDSLPWLTECLQIINSTPFAIYDVYPSTATIPIVPTTFPDGTSISEPRLRYQRAEEVLKYVLYPPGTLSSATPRTLLHCNDRKFFRTGSNRLGIGPADLKENDVLCAMYGARTIWALRPLGLRREVQLRQQEGEKECQSNNNQISEGEGETGRQEEEEEFELLGSVYTPSLLKGEAWIGKSCESMRRFKLR